MKPLRMTVSAFGSFAGRETIDWEPLGSGGLYLIAGETGTGKTTLFDALSYALFGETSTDGRGCGNIRSDYAAPETETFVELEFLHQNKKFLVRRSPNQLRRKKRGEGMTTENASASLTQSGAPLLTGYDAVTRAIEEQLGINAKQFRQVVMIAQGKFMDLLQMDTDGRTEILRKLFHTEKFKRLQDEVSGALSVLLTRNKEIREELHRVVSGVMTDGEESEAVFAPWKKQEVPPLQAEFLPKLTELINTDAERKRRLNQEKKELGGRRDRLLQEKVKAVEAQERRLELKKVEQSVLEQTSELNKLDGILSIQKEETPKWIAQQMFEIQKMEESLPHYDELEKLDNALTGLLRERNALELEIKQRDDAIDRLQKKLNVDQREQETLGNAALAERDAVTESERLTGRLSDLETLRRLFEEDQDRERGVRKDEKRRDAAETEYQRSREATLHIEKAFYDAQAGILAEELKDGFPCPVCGALEHPCPAVKSDEAPSQNKLRSARTETERLAKAVNDLRQQAALSLTRLNAGRENLMERAGVLFGETTWDKIPATVTQDVAQTSESAAAAKQAAITAQQNRERSEELNRLIPEELDRLEQEKLRHSERKNRLVQLTAEQEGMEKRRQTAAAGLCVSRDVAQAEISAKKNKIKNRQEEFQCDQRNFTKLKSELDQNTGAIKRLREQLQTSETFDLDTIIASLKDTEQKLTENERWLKQTEQRLSVNQDVRERFERFDREQAESDRQVTDIQELSNVANGKVSGQKLKLEVFVLTMFFERIIQRANLRFDVMSRGQFELRRRDESDGNSQGGLELDVLDRYCGNTRSVRTLSGGESFMAALSMALGLSDEIQSSAGGIQLDTVFIDEGFGSLSDEFRQQAVTILSELAGSNRLVGIISHISELKERITRRLVVERNDPQGGSHIRIEF